MSKSWKGFELRVAKRLGGKRIPVTGERDGADVIAECAVTGPFFYQCKMGRGFPSYLVTWLRGIVGCAERANRGQDVMTPTGVVVWRPNRVGFKDDDALVILRLKDWEAWHGKLRANAVAAAVGRAVTRGGRHERAAVANNR